MEHLPDEKISRFRDRSLSSSELLEVDDHLTECAECRDRAWSRLDVSGSVSHLRDEIQVGAAEHLEYGDLARLSGSDERLPPADPAAAHASECAMCGEDIEDLRSFRRELERTPRLIEADPALSPAAATPRFWTAAPIWGAVAAAIVLAVFLSRVTRTPPPPSAPPAESTQAELQIPAEYRQLIDRTLAQDPLFAPAVLESLMRSRGTLRTAGTPEKSYKVETPVGVVVSSERPQFKWQPVPGAKSYVVSVYDASYQKIAESPPLKAPEWTPDKPLPREIPLSWQVSAARKGRTVRFPAPPAPEAVFQLMRADDSKELNSLKARYPKSHLLIGVVCFNDGALEEAENELSQVPPASADAPAAARLIERIHVILSRRG